MRNSEKQRQARWAVAVFFTVLLTCLTASRIFGEVVPGCRDMDFWRRCGYLDKARARKPNSPFRAFMGSSRIACGVRLHSLGLDGVNFNFASLGGNPVQDFFKSSWLIRLGKKPDLMVLEAWSEGLCLDPEPQRWLSELAVWERKLYSQWAQDPSFYSGPWDYVSNVPQDLDPPVRFFFPNWMRENFRRTNRFDDLGGMSHDVDTSDWTPERLQQQVQKSLDAHAPLMKEFHPQNVHLAALRQQLEMCREHSIPVLLVMAPSAPAYRKGYGPIHLADSQKLWKSLEQEFGCKSIDSSDWGQDSDFFDGYHLFDRSAERYSQWLGQRIRQLGL